MQIAPMEYKTQWR